MMKRVIDKIWRIEWLKASGRKLMMVMLMMGLCLSHKVVILFADGRSGNTIPNAAA